MAAIESLHTHLVDELVDLLDAENQLTQALPKLAKSASSKRLRAALQKHVKETRGHIRRLDQALRALGENPRRKPCEGMEGLLKESDAMMNNTPAGALRDAVMITGAQKVEHYEMASYGTARTYAQVLGEREVARLLAQTLKEEKAADLTLTQIAQSSINEEAAEEWHGREEAGVLGLTAEWAGSTAAYASRQLAKGVRTAASAVGVANDRQSRAKASHNGGRSHRSSTERPGAGTKKR